METFSLIINLNLVILKIAQWFPFLVLHLKSFVPSWDIQYFIFQNDHWNQIILKWNLLHASVPDESRSMTCFPVTSGWLAVPPSDVTCLTCLVFTVQWPCVVVYIPMNPRDFIVSVLAVTSFALWPGCHVQHPQSRPLHKAVRAIENTMCPIQSVVTVQKYSVRFIWLFCSLNFGSCISCCISCLDSNKNEKTLFLFIVYYMYVFDIMVKINYRSVLKWRSVISVWYGYWNQK